MGNRLQFLTRKFTHLLPVYTCMHAEQHFILSYCWKVTDILVRLLRYVTPSKNLSSLISYVC